MRITIDRKNKIKERLFFVYLFYSEGFDLDEQFENSIFKKFDKFMQSQNKKHYSKPNLELIKFELENRLLLMTISLLCEMFEQFLGDIIISELKIKEGLDFNMIKKMFFDNGYDLESNSHWETVNELRLLVNVIKHGDGSSRKKLQKIRQDYFDHENIIKNTLNDVELNIWDDDLENYFLELMNFIDELPE